MMDCIIYSLKWHLKCKTILECELATLPEKQKCQKVIAWSGDFRMDLYVSWSLPKEELTLDTIWDRFEEFFKPQSNDVRACFDLLTSFSQGNRNVDEWYNAVQLKVNLAKYSPETAKILHRDIFCFFMKDEDFVTKTINEGNIDMQKFPTSKVRQLAKKMESLKATAKHIRQVAGDLPAAQIHFMCHQHTELPTGKYNKQKNAAKQKPQNHRPTEHQTSKKPFDLRNTNKQSDRCLRCADTMHAKGFQCPTKKFQCKVCHKFGHFTTFCSQKNQQILNSFKPRKPKACQLRAGALYTHQDGDSNISKESSMDELFCLQMKVQKTQLKHQQLPIPVYLMTNLAYHLKMHHRWNQYLHARLDTCADVNLMPVAVYQLMFKDPGLKKLTPSTLELETYTNDFLKIIDSC